MTGRTRGLIVGKFYPPHLGHLDGIQRAAACCDQLIVLVMASAVETIPLCQRVDWLRQDCSAWPRVVVDGIPCDVPVDLTDEDIWIAQIALMRTAVKSASGNGDIDLIFTAEPYGPELARRLGAELIELRRPLHGPSGRAARSDLSGNWKDLAPAARAGLTLRSVFVGAESTGTTTVSRAVADHYRARGGVFADTAWVGEFGREYTEIKWAAARAKAIALHDTPPALDEIVWEADDFDAVAIEQNRRAQEALQDGSPLVVCDTDAFATAIWERRYIGAGARQNQPWAQTPILPRPDIYFITDHAGVPWQDDGLREGDMSIRAAMTEWFKESLTNAGHSWVLLSGKLERRVATAVRTIDPLLKNRWALSRPLQGPGFESDT